MIDIHCHPLWATDDGPREFETAVEMCRLAASDGITHLVATPHCNYAYPFEPEVNRAKLEQLQEAIGESPRLMLGCDFHLSYDNIQQLIERKGDFTINNTAYVLVEFGEQFVPEQYDRVFYQIQVAGLIPIITHPERNGVFRRKAGLLYQWVSRGCLAQITAQSYTGDFGAQALAACELWLSCNLVHFVASDAHDLSRRPPVLSAAYQKLASAKGRPQAELLFRRNPQAVIDGRPLPPNSEPIDPGELRPRRRHWFSLFKKFG